MAYLFGDILAVGWDDLLVIWGGAAAVIALMAWRWSALLTVTVSEDLARAGGLDPGREKAALILSLALVVAVAIKVVGALLITAMLIIPAAAARPLARTPEGMVAIAAVIGTVSVLAGLGGAFEANSPAGPSIVVAALVIFTLSAAIPARFARGRR